MMIQMTCRAMPPRSSCSRSRAGTRTPQSGGQDLHAAEQAYYAHHPGRFVYLRDDDTGELFPAPYEPVRAKVDGFRFIAGRHELSWDVEHLGLRVEMQLMLPTDDVVEL